MRRKPGLHAETPQSRLCSPPDVRSTYAVRMPPCGETPIRLSKGFAALAEPFDLAVLDSMPAMICGAWPDLRLAYVNRAWLAFAASNGAPQLAEHGGLGTDLLLVLPTVLRPFYEEMFRRARATGEVSEHDYECSSPEKRRVFHMRVHPCSSGALVITHSLVREALHLAEACEPLEALYRDAQGMIVQCANCRRIRGAAADTDSTATWDWVPEYVAQIPPRTSHGLCFPCFQFHYP